MFHLSHRLFSCPIKHSTVSELYLVVFFGAYSSNLINRVINYRYNVHCINVLKVDVDMLNAVKSRKKRKERCVG